MKNLYLLGVDPELTKEFSSYQEVATSAKLNAFSTSDEAVSAAQKLESSSSVMVLGAELAEPIQTLQRLHTLRPNLVVVVLCEADKCEFLKKSIQFTPFIGKSVRVVPQADTQMIAQEIQSAFVEAAQKHHYQELIAATNRELFVKTEKTSIDPTRTKQIFFDRILESAPIGISSVDPQGAVLSWNNGARDIIGLSELQMLGTNFTDLFQNTETKRTLRLQFQRSSSPIEYKSVPVVFSRDRASGFDQYLEITIASVTGNQNDRGAVVIFQDVTERVNANLAKEEKELQLVEAVQIRDEFLSIASHELKTPLTPLKLQLQRLDLSLKKGQLGNIPEEQISRILSICDKQINRLSRLIDDLLDVARITGRKLTLNFEEIDFVPFCTQVIEQYQETAKVNGTSLNLIVGPDITLSGDQLRLEQVIANLISNAIKFSANRPIELWVGKRNEFAVLSIRDFGIGVESKNLQRIFDRFERVNSPSNVGGLGLGLYISRQIINAHGGNITVQNMVPTGAMFTIQLPIATHLKMETNFSN